MYQNVAFCSLLQTKTLTLNLSRAYSQLLKSLSGRFSGVDMGPQIYRKQVGVPGDGINISLLKWQYFDGFVKDRFRSLEF